MIGMKDWSERLGKTTQAETLPGFTRLIESGRDLEPVLAHGITVVGGAMSDTARQGREAREVARVQG
ncbi:hypothetical protein [Amycolatopsis sp. BJA-103]|uniref:hypothetical protein n=1 Tax=Amycolatopsis sp. BJA-103 TaxID=1911175 RepID=UPI0013053E53|nr:hypothetical protein [Amycolatopsis sp. BJA-103]